jgi:plastocyanin
MNTPLHSPLRSPLRWAAVVMLLATAGTHIPLVPEHLDEAPYIGVLFILLSVVSILLAVAVAVRDTRLVWLATGVVGVLSVVAFFASRTVGLPQIGDDVGNWTEPLGYPAVVAELAAAVLAVLAVRHRRAMSRGLHSRVVSVAALGLLASAALAGCGSSSADSSGSSHSSGSHSSAMSSSEMSSMPSSASSSASSSTSASSSAAAPASLMIMDCKYSGARKVAPGAKITVHNMDSEAHTVTSDKKGAFDVNVLPGKMTVLTAPTAPGTYKYHCTYHGNMHGTLVVG